MPTDGEGHVATHTPDAAASGTPELPPEVELNDAPAGMGNEAASAWAAGYNNARDNFIAYERMRRNAQSSRIAALEGANASLVSLLQQLQSSFDSRMESVGASSLDEARFIAPLAYSVDAALKSALASPAGAEGGNGNG